MTLSTPQCVGQLPRTPAFARSRPAAQPVRTGHMPTGAAFYFRSETRARALWAIPSKLARLSFHRMYSHSNERRKRSAALNFRARACSHLYIHKYSSISSKAVVK